jgi:hypothetical protein
MFGHWGKMLPTKPPRLTELARQFFSEVNKTGKKS